MNTTIPFSGFYESWHSQAVDTAVEQMIQNSSGNDVTSDTIAQDFWGHVDYRKVFIEYAKEYLYYFEKMINCEAELTVKFIFDELVSPREYNFETDRIFAKVSQRAVKSLYKACDKKILDDVIKERFTSCSGFISHYEPNRKLWGSVLTWDHNQIGTILEALAKQYLSEGWLDGFLEGLNCNGELDRWIYRALDDEGIRLLKISDYLRNREERKFRTKWNEK